MRTLLRSVCCAAVACCGPVGADVLPVAEVASGVLRFHFVPTGEGDLKAEVVDKKDLKFETKLTVRRGARPG